jgi:hypothetical protein
MALSPERIAQAKAEAELFLEHSIVMLASVLGVDLDEIEGEYINPLAQSENETANRDYYNHERLRRQIDAINVLRG